MFNDYRKINERVSITIPATREKNITVDNSLFVEFVAAALADYFGGASAVQLSGWYRSESGEMIAEKSVEVYAYTDAETLAVAGFFASNRSKSEMSIL